MALVTGKDEKGWGMYVDHQRSWFMSSGMHTSRTDGGIAAGSTVGVLLDLDKRQLTFYVNEEQQVSSYSERIPFITIFTLNFLIGSGSI